MRFKLDIYEGKGKIGKTYTADAYDLMFGTMEDFLNVIDLDKFSSDNQADFVGAVSNLVIGSLEQLKPLLMDVFEGLTEDELRRAKVKDLVKVIIDIIRYSVIEINGASTQKNA